MNKVSKDRYAGCLLGGAVGDALGAPTEFMELAEIIDEFGPGGVSDYVEYDDVKGRFSSRRELALP